MSRDWQAVTSRNPCRICGAKRRCAVTSDGHASKCCYDLGSPGVAATGADEVGDYAIYFSKDATAAFRQNFHASSSVPETPIADVEVRDKVYRELLRVLNLSPEHHDNLARRGLSSEDIEEAGYRTLPSSGHAQIYRKMIGAFGGIVGGRIPDGVPGFHAGKITSSGGMLIPVRNTDGSVVAVKIRTDATTGSDAANTDAAAVDRPKYIWLSSKSRDGASPGMHVHAPFRRAGEDECPEVRVTEGPLKADVATRLSGVYTIGIPGATAVRSILPVLTELGAKRVLLAWDADASKNKHVAGGLELAATILSEAGLEICVETWDVEDDGKPKGIDDALLAETPLALHEGVEAWAKIAEICRAAGRTPSKTTQEKIDASGEDDEDDKDDVGGTMVRLSGVPSGGAPSLPGDRADGVRGPGDGGDHGGGGGAGGDGGGDGDGGDGDGVAPAPATPPDNWQTLFLTDRRGIIRQSYANACNILRYDPKFFGRIRFNSMSQTVMLDNEPLTDIAASEAREWIDREYGVDFGTDMIWSVFARVGNERKFHPVRDYLNSLVWDGVPRLYRVAAEILGAPRKLHAAMVAKTFIAAVERAFYPGCKVEVALVLGGNQGWRKSTFFNVMGMQWFSDTPFDITSKEAYMQIGDCWIVELGEIDRITTKKDAEEIKPFLSSQFDRYVPKYGRSVINRPRGCIFVGTTNREKFLNDPTGDRRFWCVPVGCVIKIDLLRTWVHQLWAEAVAISKACKEPLETRGRHLWCLTEEEERERDEDAEDHRIEDPWEGMVDRYVEAQGRRDYTTEEVLSGAIELPKKDQGAMQEKRICAILRKLGYRHAKHRPLRNGVRGKPTWCWLLPEKRVTSAGCDQIGLLDGNVNARGIFAAPTSAQPQPQYAAHGAQEPQNDAPEPTDTSVFDDWDTHGDA